MNETKEFVIWKTDNKEELEKQYRTYLIDVANDKEFEIEAIELFSEWLEVEFERLEEEENEQNQEIEDTRGYGDKLQDWIKWKQ